MESAEKLNGNERPRRPRLKIKNKMEGATVVKDELAFVQNLGSKNAREIKTIPEYINLELWYDKHYIIDRNQHEDNEGKKRDIPPVAVEALVGKSLKHLIFYGSCIKGFSFLNHADGHGLVRIAIKDSPNKNPLSIIVQAHFKNFNKYQFTVITAIDGDIRLSAGQYLVEFVDDNCSTLKKFDSGILTEVFTCQD